MTPYPRNTKYIDYPSVPEQARECEECGTTENVEQRVSARVQITCPAHPGQTLRGRLLCDECDDTHESLEALIQKKIEERQSDDGNDIVAAVRYECGWFTTIREPDPPTTDVIEETVDDDGETTYRRTEQTLPDRFADEPTCQLRCECGAHITQLTYTD